LKEYLPPSNAGKGLFAVLVHFHRWVRVNAMLAIIAHQELTTPFKFQWDDTQV